MLDQALYDYLRRKDGINQEERSLPGLAADFVVPEERSTEDILRFFSVLAEQLNFYDLNNAVQGDWRVFFRELLPPGSNLNTGDLSLFLRDRDHLSPHLALWLACLEVYRKSIGDLNTLTARHQAYYYEKVLQLPRVAARPYAAHLLFEINRNNRPVRLPAGTLFPAGQDGDRPLQFALAQETIVQPTEISALHSLYVDRNFSDDAIVFTSTDASLVKEETDVSWPLFGAPQLGRAPENRQMTAAELGFAVASPLLRLAEGARIVSLELHLDFIDANIPGPQPLSNFLRLAISGEEGWHYPSQFTAELTATPSILLTLELSAEDPPIVALDPDLHPGRFPAGQPVLRMVFDPESYQIDAFRNVAVGDIDLSVSVTGVRQLVVQNDQGRLNAEQPMALFGSTPKIGSRFYVGSPEVFSKPLTQLNLNLEWEEAPFDLEDHYRVYAVPKLNNTQFTVAIDLLAGRSWDHPFPASHRLFDAGDPTAPWQISLSGTDITDLLQNSSYRLEPEISFDRYTQNIRQGFIRLTLNGPTRDGMDHQPPDHPFSAFGHSVFAPIYARQAMELARWDGIGTSPELPNPPYTPVLSEFSLDYDAAVTFSADSDRDGQRFYGVDAFGVVPGRSGQMPWLVPELPAGGALYLGLQKITPPLTVSLLFQLVAGSIPGAELLRSEQLQWSFLTDRDEWKSLGVTDVVLDTTDVLQQAGIIRLNLGQEATATGARMPAGSHWLRLTTDNPLGAATVENIHSRAGLAEEVIPDGVERQSDAAALAPGTIAAFQRKPAGIKAVTQPFPAFGGRGPETDDSYFRRVSERLRHRQRGVTPYDYERIVLAQFPEVFKVKTLEHADAENRIRPGYVRLIVVPDFRRFSTGNPLQPRLSRTVLRRIQEEIAQKYATPFTEILVDNPVYETLLVDCRVAFQAGFDPGFYGNQLNEDILRFLSPWAFDEGRDIVFGGRIYRSEILAFVEGRPYVDFVVDFQLFHRFDGPPAGGINDMTIDLDFVVGNTPTATIGAMTIGSDFIIGESVETAVVTRPDAILVSAARHRISALGSDDLSCAGQPAFGIGSMIVGIDFIPIT